LPAWLHQEVEKKSAVVDTLVREANLALGSATVAVRKFPLQRHPLSFALT